jgi:hypothetical protein
MIYKETELGKGKILSLGSKEHSNHRESLYIRTAGLRGEG